MIQECTVGEVARLLGGTVDGDAGRVLSGVAPLETAGPAELSWLGDRRYEGKLRESRAGAVLAQPGISRPAAVAALVVVQDPDESLCRVLEAFGPQPVRVERGVHGSAVVAQGAQVEGVAIGPHVFVGERARIGVGSQLHAGVYIGADVLIGRDCVLWPGVVIRERCRLGDRVVVHANSTIGADGFGYLRRSGGHRKIPHIGIVEIGDDVEIGANCAIDRGKTGVTRIGSGVKIDNLVQVAHNCEIGDRSILVSQCGLSGSVRLGADVVLAGQVGIADHKRLGDGVVVAAQSGVADDLAGPGMYGGTPAVEQRENLREMIAKYRLADLIQDFRRLSKRVEKLESSADDRT